MAYQLRLPGAPSSLWCRRRHQPPKTQLGLSTSSSSRPGSRPPVPPPCTTAPPRGDPPPARTLGRPAPSAPERSEGRRRVYGALPSSRSRQRRTTLRMVKLTGASLAPAPPATTRTLHILILSAGPAPSPLWYLACGQSLAQVVSECSGGEWSQNAREEPSRAAPQCPGSYPPP